MTPKTEEWGLDPEPRDDEINLIEDRALAKQIMRSIDKLERMNDAVGNTPIRHRISEHLVSIRLLARDGHTQAMNGE